jgi:poly-gamma-glutamate synthesis protein (capsule biosynthesis protein)
MVKPVRFSRVIPLAVILAVLLTVSVSSTGTGGIGSRARAVGDLDGDGMTEEYILVDHHLTVREGEKYLWRSPSNWRIDNFALGDVDNDGTVNLVLTLWKTGSFGSIKPFWQTAEDTSYKNHLFVYRLQNKAMKQVWCSSDLDRPIVSFTIRDVDGDGPSLVVEEGKYRNISGERYALDTKAPVRTTVWRWDEWGFRLITY